MKRSNWRGLRTQNLDSLTVQKYAKRRSTQRTKKNSIKIEVENSFWENDFLKILIGSINCINNRSCSKFISQFEYVDYEYHVEKHLKILDPEKLHLIIKRSNNFPFVCGRVVFFDWFAEFIRRNSGKSKFESLAFYACCSLINVIDYIYYRI